MTDHLLSLTLTESLKYLTAHICCFLPRSLQSLITPICMLCPAPFVEFSPMDALEYSRSPQGVIWTHIKDCSSGWMRFTDPQAPLKTLVFSKVTIPPLGGRRRTLRMEGREGVVQWVGGPQGKVPGCTTVTCFSEKNGGRTNEYENLYSFLINKKCIVLLHRRHCNIIRKINHFTHFNYAPLPS